MEHWHLNQEIKEFIFCAPKDYIPRSQCSLAAITFNSDLAAIN